MTAPFDQDDEPTAMFVPTWDDEDHHEHESHPNGLAAPTEGVGARDRGGAAVATADPGPEVEGPPGDDPEVAAPSMEASPMEAPPMEAPSMLPPPGEAEQVDDPQVEDPQVADDAEVTARSSAPVVDDIDTTIEAEPVAAPVPEPPAGHIDDGRDETGPGTLRPMAPEPVVEARRARARPAPPRSPAARAGEQVRAAVGLLVLVVGAGVGLAAAIGLVAFAIAFLLQRVAGA